jgi:Sulfotransferase domain
MKVIGVGVPRTGTLSQKVALEMLGVGPCYHMVNVLGDLTQVPLWTNALDGAPDWSAIFGQCRSTVDWPGGFFYRELMEFYPEAKLVLSTRDPDEWEKSMRDTVWGTYFGGTLISHLSYARTIVDPQWDAYISMMKRMLWEDRGTFVGTHEKPGQLADGLVRFHEEVQSTVPADRLLVWSVGEGWEPLCDFLGAEVPDAPFPRLNDSKQYIERVITLCLSVLDAWWAEQQGPADQSA